MITPKILFRVQKGNLETFEYLTTIKEPGVFQGAHVYKSLNGNVIRFKDGEVPGDVYEKKAMALNVVILHLQRKLKAAEKELAALG